MPPLDFDSLLQLAKARVRLEQLLADPLANAELITQLQTGEFQVLNARLASHREDEEAVEGLAALFRQHPAANPVETFFGARFEQFEARLSQRIHQRAGWLKFRAFWRHLFQPTQAAEHHGFSWRLATATVCSLLLLAVVLVYSRNSTADRLYATYLNGLPTGGYAEGNVMGGPNAPASQGHLSSLSEQYRAGNLATVLQLYQALPQPTPEESYYAGCAYLDKELLQPARAVACFKAVLAHPERATFTDEARYFLVFAYLKNNQPDQADALLTQIRADEGFAFRRDEVNDFWFFLQVKLMSLFN
ncbi:MAG: hypothetical protein MUC97_04450 [Bernardetiaceae bacterium]|jgi:hypothetical protein|nr:hypothetical protein [Bernardetiaceae bacterium]